MSDDMLETFKGRRITHFSVSSGYRGFGTECEICVDGNRWYWFDVNQFMKLLNNNVSLKTVKKRKRTWVEIVDKKGYRNYSLEMKKLRKRNKEMQKKYAIEMLGFTNRGSMSFV